MISASPPHADHADRWRVFTATSEDWGGFSRAEERIERKLKATKARTFHDMPHNSID